MPSESIATTESRWERIGFTKIHRKNYLESATDRTWLGRYSDVIGESTPESLSLPSDYGRRSDLHFYIQQLNLSHLEFQERPDDIRELTQQMCAVGVDYFCGNWRDHGLCDDGVFDREQCRKNLKWFDELRMALIAATILDDQEAVNQIAGYVDLDLHYDEGAWDYAEEDNKTYMCLAHLIVKKSLKGVTEVIEAIQSSRRKRAKLFLDGIVAISNGNSDKTCDAIREVVRIFRKRGLPEGLMVASWEGTILWNLSRMMELSPKPLKLPEMDYIMTPSTVFGE